jgi:hypothetical protein
MTSHKLRNSSKNMRHTPADAPATPHLLYGVTPRSLAYRLLCGAAPAILGTLAATVVTVNVSQAQQAGAHGMVRPQWAAARLQRAYRAMP